MDHCKTCIVEVIDAGRKLSGALLIVSFISPKFWDIFWSVTPWAVVNSTSGGILVATPCLDDPERLVLDLLSLWEDEDEFGAHAMGCSRNWVCSNSGACKSIRKSTMRCTLFLLTIIYNKWAIIPLVETSGLHDIMCVTYDPSYLSTLNRRQGLKFPVKRAMGPI